MTVVVPLPGWMALLRAARPVPVNRVQLAAPWTRGENVAAGWLSKTAWSLALVAHWRKQFQDGRRPCVWVPNYFCNGSLLALRQLPARLHFYPVMSDLRPDYRSIRQQVKEQPPDIFLLVHYFGLPAPAAEAREFCKHVDAWLVEDATHVLQPIPGVGVEGDFILYSPHKLLALPHGALLLARPQGASKLGEQGLARLGEPASWAGQLKSEFAISSVGGGVWQTLAWSSKRILQKLGLGSSLRPLAFVDEPGHVTLPGPDVSQFSLRLLEQYLKDLPMVRAWRQRHQLMLDELVVQSGCYGLVPDWRLTKGSYTPYIAPYRADDPEAAFSSLRARGVHASTWPDLPPEVVAVPGQHKAALDLRASHIFLPLHQSLRSRDISCGFEVPQLQPVVASIELQEINCCQSWRHLLEKTSASNLLQSWSYGESKASTDNWQPRRLVLKYSGQPVALVQVLQRRLGRFVTISRINRGPLFLPGANPALEQACFNMLSNVFGCWSRGRMLFWAPECRLHGSSLIQLQRAGFYLMSPRGWSSSIIDLGQSEDKLRAGLSGGWRNMLNVAHRQQLDVEEVRDSVVFEGLLVNCSEMMRARGMPFPAHLYRALWKQMELDRESCLLLAVRCGEELLAATWTVQHGNSSTYLMGWSGEQGRKLHAHHILLWETMLRLKVRGLRWFDSGGIDEERTGGIAAFKLGLGGERYSLVGEGWCC